MKRNLIKGFIAGSVAVLITMGTLTTAMAQSGGDGLPTIEGVWQVTRMGVNCNDPNQQLGPSFPAIMTFHRDGITTAATKAPVGGPFDTPEYGLWQREPGSQNYSFRDVSYRYDANGAFAGSSVITASVDLTSANSFEYSATIEFFDANGNPLFTRCGKATGTRFE
jgi:hypothetical protein